MIIGIIRFFRGIVRFRIHNGFVERFINLCAHGGVPLWGGHKIDGVYSACTTLKGSHRLESFAQKAGVTLEMDAPWGVPALWQKGRGRIGLLGGAVVLLVSLFFMSSFVWQIDIVGAQRVEEQNILDVLRDLGVRRGTLCRSIDAVDISRQMLLRLPDLSWAAVNIRGSVATVEIKERVVPPPRVDDKIPHNVVANKTGFITYMEVYEGQPTVKVGDSVMEGDILVSGIMEDKNSFSRTVHARAKIIAQSRETLSLNIPYQQENVTYRGLVVRKSMEIFSLQLPLTLQPIPQSPYKLEVFRRNIPFLSTLAPFSIIHENYILLNQERYTITQEEARLLAQLQIPQMEATAFLGQHVLERELTGQALPQGFLLTGTYLVEGEIGQEREILLETSQ